MVKVYLSLGSNLDDRKGYLERAVDVLENHGEINIFSKSSIYESNPEGYKDQPDFYNAVIGVETKLSPTDFLKVCQRIEDQLGRVRKEKWGPRTIDVDILLFDNKEIDLKDLKIPHPYLTSRGFVLVPLLEIAPEAMLPSKKSLKLFLANLPPNSYPNRVGNLRS